MNNITIPTALQLMNISANLPLDKLNGKYWRCIIHEYGHVYTDAHKAHKDEYKISSFEDIILEAVPFIGKNSYQGTRWKFTGSVWVSDL